MPQSEVQHPKVDEGDRSDTYGKPADVNTLRQRKRPFVVAERIRDFVLKKHPPPGSPFVPIWECIPSPQNKKGRIAPALLLLVRLTLNDHFGVTWIRAPGLASSSIHSEPSGPSSTSRMRLPTFQRSADFAPPWPSKMKRLSEVVPIPPMKPLPFHCGKVWVPL